MPELYHLGFVWSRNSGLIKIKWVYFLLCSFAVLEIWRQGHKALKRHRYKTTRHQSAQKCGTQAVSIKAVLRAAIVDM